MEAKAIVPRKTRAGEGKAVKHEPGQRSERRALGDIGNLEVVRIVEGKQISRPMTRSFRAQLLANAQAAARENKNQVIPALDNKAIVQAAAEKKKNLLALDNKAIAQASGDKKKNPVVPILESKAVATKKAGAEKSDVETHKPKPESSDVLSSFGGENLKLDSGRSSREGSRKKEFKTLTSVLSARSKAACGVSLKPKEKILDIDAEDINNELAAVEYLDDMYKFYKLAEDESHVHDYMGSQREINVKMRSILVDWLIDVHRRFELMPETLFLTINIIDRYLSVTTVARKEFQLVGLSSMLIASKYEEIWAPHVNDLVCISDYAYTEAQILVMEKAILGKLEWYLTVPTPYVFLVRYVKASFLPDQEMENMAFFLAELGLLHYPTILYSSSMIAAGAVYAARCTLNRCPFWSETLKHHTGYSEDQILDCAKLLVSFHSIAAESKLQAVCRKFSNPDRGAVAFSTPAQKLLATAL
ncbi:Cyclin family protein [Quillaja saponaria]|uniref:B-like cyclin n=1 Tax=Quillaja saponaria TaxID=32244 RepID=A0AAD7QG62_QUISA|nr:Cyclin family protein [Quillaja saponaria]